MSSAQPAVAVGDRGSGRGRPELDVVAAALGRPVTRADERLVAVGAPLAGLLPEGGLRRGTTVGLAPGAGSGAMSLALALVATATASGSWVAAVGLPALGLVAAAQLGVALDRLALVPAPGAQWPVVAAALLDSIDIVVLAPTGRPRAADARRLAARARERGAVLMVVDDGAWPEGPDLRLQVTGARWDGLDVGAGHLRRRLVTVTVTGRRAASRPRHRQVWLPGPDGRVVAAGPAADAATEASPGRPPAAGISLAG